MFSAHLYARVRIFLCAIAHEIAGAARTRHSLLPLFLRRDNEIEALGRNEPRERETVRHTLTRHRGGGETVGRMDAKASPLTLY